MVGALIVLLVVAVGVTVWRYGAPPTRRTAHSRRRGCLPRLRRRAPRGCRRLHPGEAVGTLLERADAALYEAKAAGRNRIAGERSGSLT
jgi:hypothetical protein